MEKLSIGKMAKLNQVSVQALRLYDEMNILNPIDVNEDTGYRYYDVKQSAQLDMIKYMKNTGMSLKEIRDIFHNRDLQKLNQILHNQLLEIDVQINELNMQKKAVKKMIDSYNRYITSPSDKTITLEYIEERKLYMHETNINFYDLGLEAYENVLKDMKNEMQKKGISDIYYYNAGTTIYKEDFIKSNYVSHQSFVFIDQDYENESITSLPASMYACIYCDSYEKELQYIPLLYDYILNNDMNITGDYLCEVLTELPITASNKREMFLRLQVPINFVKK